MSKTIFTALSPNVEKDDLALALRVLLRPRQWVRGEARSALERGFAEWLPSEGAFAFASGRGALYAILQAFGIQKDDEVLLQAYTCVAVPEPVLWVGAVPVYVDIQRETFNMSPDDLQKKISPKSKVLIIQHTFGLPSELEPLLNIAKNNGLLVVEDCAHAMSAKYKGRHVGTFGDASFFSFGRDKVLSSVFGGIAVLHSEQGREKMRDIVIKTEEASMLFVLQQIAHPLVTSGAKALYHTASLGKILLAVAKRLRVLSKAVLAEEKQGGKPEFLAKKMPNALALLALNQFQKLARYNTHRREIAQLYDAAFGRKTKENHLYLRYTLTSVKRDEIARKAKIEGIILGDWYSVALAPRGVEYQKFNYNPRACPFAEKAAGSSLNLPTHINVTKSDARRIIAFLKTFIRKSV